jgi:hypothetical protein
MAASTLSSTALARTDLDKYNVLILPSASGGPTTYKRLLAEGGVKHLKEWIEDGGTLVAVGSAAAFVADTSVGLISVRQKRQVLEKLDEYSSALALAKEAESPSVDSLAVWEGKRPEGDEESADGAVSDVTKEADELARKLSPSGVIMGEFGRGAVAQLRPRAGRPHHGAWFLQLRHKKERQCGGAVRRL